MSGSQRRIVPCDRHEDDFSAFSMHLCRIMPPYGSTSRSLARLTSSIASPGLVLPGGGGGGIHLVCTKKWAKLLRRAPRWIATWHSLLCR